MDLDVTQALKDAENTLRDFIAYTLEQAHGKDWPDKCGLTADRIAQWRDRKATEEKRQKGGAVDERLIYYAQFHDLAAMLRKNWDSHFSEALGGDIKTIELYLKELENLRDPDAHRRELLPHQKALAVGIAGQIRAMITRYRSRKETSADCFPRIESVHNTLNETWTPGLSMREGGTLHVGDVVDFVVTASDPDGLPLEYACVIAYDDDRAWSTTNTFSVRFKQEHIGLNVSVTFLIRSPRSYHARPDCDDRVTFLFTVLPAR